MNRDSVADLAGSNGSNVAKKGVFWNAIGILTRQFFLVVSSILLARILGPESYAIVALAGVYTAFATLLLDQGLTSPLISKKEITRNFVGAATTLNILSAIAIALLTVALAPIAGRALGVPALEPVLCLFAVALPLKALSIAPRAILARSVNFKIQAIIDVVSSIIGGIVLIISIMATGNYWSFVYQVIAVDACVALGLILSVKPPLPNFRLNLLSDSFMYGGRVLISNLLSYGVQNVDNILVGRYLGPVELSYYSVAYRLVTTPVQLVGQIVSRVLFPVTARYHNQNKPVDGLVGRVILITSSVMLPSMAFIAVSAQDLVQAVLGADWSSAALTLAIFAIAGARQTITTLNSPVLMGIDRTDILLKFSMLAASVQVSAIVFGLQWGINGVAVCYTTAGFILTPLIMRIQKRTIGLSYRRQMAAVLPGLHCAFWVVVAYLVLGWVTNFGPYITLLTGLILCLLSAVLVLWACHRSSIGSEFETALKLRKRRSLNNGAASDSDSGGAI
ncbi:lipopolysaccharide biosynthesis protein [Rhodococcus sp. 24CO]|uniref:lipopolysaccharide biosynthesis protein n=1 Tax=Rhodococcus sp. 24CO TaxID=3117460 RepID=UPI003D33AD5A